jgi:DNA-binding PadR family transcriptional regulator
MRRTATTAQAILGLLALRPRWTTWELTRQMRRNMRFFWPRAESRIFAEARGLEGAGLAAAEQSFVGRRGRTTYAITEAGRESLRRWLATPPGGTTLECEAVLRVFLADLSGADAVEHVGRALARVRADAHAILDVGRVAGPEYLEGTAPFQDQIHVRALVFDFLSHHARMLLDWAERTEAALAEWRSQSAEERAAAARGRIAEHLAAFPPPAVPASIPPAVHAPCSDGLGASSAAAGHAPVAAKGPRRLEGAPAGGGGSLEGSGS